jgi:hypothetical protein
MEFPATMPTSLLNEHSISMSGWVWIGESINVSLTRGSGKGISRHWDGTPIPVRLDGTKDAEAVLAKYTTIRIGVGGNQSG